jgi:hypothetical protein
LIAEERRKDDDGTEVDDGSSDSWSGTRPWETRLLLNGYFRKIGIGGLVFLTFVREA